MRQVDSFRAELSGKALALSYDLLVNSGLNGNQYQVLLTGIALCSQGNCTTKLLLEKLSMSRNTLTKVLSELEELGFLTRKTIETVNGTFGGNTFIFHEERKMSNFDTLNSTEPKNCARTEDKSEIVENQEKDNLAVHKNCAAVTKICATEPKNCAWSSHARIEEYTSNTHNNSYTSPTVVNKEQENISTDIKETEILPPTTPSKRRTVQFKKPTVEEVREYVIQKGYTEIDPEAFVLHYESNGWMVGKTKMKNWHAAIGTWHKQRNNYGNNRKPSRQERDEQFARHIAEKLSRPTNFEDLDIF